MNESSMASFIKETVTVLKDIRKESNEFSKHDYTNAEYILEMKARKGKHWPDTLIEKKKFDHLVSKAEESNRVALYVVYSAGNIYFFNLTRLSNEGVDFGWHTRKCKATTEFSNNQYVDKEVGLIHWDMAKVVKSTCPF